jgi:hypothetical protein
VLIGAGPQVIQQHAHLDATLRRLLHRDKTPFHRVIHHDDEVFDVCEILGFLDLLGDTRERSGVVGQEINTVAFDSR